MVDNGHKLVINPPTIITYSVSQDQHFARNSKHVYVCNTDKIEEFWVVGQTFLGHGIAIFGIAVFHFSIAIEVGFLGH